MIRLAAVFALVATPAVAACPVDSHFLSCTLKGGVKKLEVCREDSRASYWFGSVSGKAELALTARTGEFEYVPWPGAGKNIWEEISFINNGVRYTVHGVHERIYPEDETADIEVITHGGVTVSKDGKELANLRCDAGSARFSW